MHVFQSVTCVKKFFWTKNWHIKAHLICPSNICGFYLEYVKNTIFLSEIHTNLQHTCLISLPHVMSTGEAAGAYRPGGSRGEGSEGCDTGPEHGARGLEQPGGGAAEQRQFTSSRLLPYSTRAGVQLPHPTLHYHPTRTLTTQSLHASCCDQNTWTLIQYNIQYNSDAVTEHIFL